MTHPLPLLCLLTLLGCAADPCPAHVATPAGLKLVEPPLDADGTLCAAEGRLLRSRHVGPNLHGVVDRYTNHFANHGWTVTARAEGAAHVLELTHEGGARALARIHSDEGAVWTDLELVSTPAPP